MRELASQIKTKQRQGFPTPFINIELNKFLPPIHPQHVAADVEGLKAKVRFILTDVWRLHIGLACRVKWTCVRGLLLGSAMRWRPMCSSTNWISVRR